MTSRIRHVTFDCHDPRAVAPFWAAVLGYDLDPDGDLVTDPRGLHPGLLFLPVPEPRAGKNRVHLDLVPDRPRDEAVAEALALGGTLVADHRNPDGTGWAVLADPEGNELCIERSAAERGDPAPVDTGWRDMPPIRTDGEREQLVAMLDWYRDGILLKVEGVAPAVARATPLRSATSIAGLVKHLAAVEDGWFTRHFAGRPLPEPWASAPWADDPDWEFHSARDEPLAASVALYEAAVARSRAVAAAHALDDPASEVEGRVFVLRWALVHMLEETARHLGHLDVLRELLDGATGD
jgi:hypothetical protein